MWWFIGCILESRASKVGLHKQKKDTSSAKLKKGELAYCVDEDKDSRSVLKRRKTWPRATENIVHTPLAQRGDMLVLVSLFTVKKLECLEFVTWEIVARSVASRRKKNTPLAKKLLR